MSKYLFSAAVFATFASFTLAGCSASPDAPQPTPLLDAGGEAAAVADGGLDAPGPPANLDGGPKAPYVTVKVLHAARPLADVSVVFHDDAGEVLEVVRTDLTGRARSKAPAPTMASALIGNDGNRHIVTWTGLEMGDELVTEDYSAYRDIRRYKTSVGKYAIDTTAVPGSTDYIAFAGPCLGFGNGTAPILLDIYTQCEAPMNTLVVRSADPAAPAKRYYSWKKNVPAPPAGGVTPVTMGPFVPGETVSVDLVNRAPGQSAMASVTDFVGVQPQFGPTSLFFSSPQDSALSMPPGGFADARQVNVIVAGETNDGTYRSIVVRGAPKLQNPVDLAQLLPKVTSGTVAAADPARFELGWTTAAPVATADGFVVRVRYADPKVDEHYAWTFVLPPSATKVRAPKMPSVAAPWLPDAKRSLFNTPHVWMMDFDGMSSYAAFRSVGAPVMPLDEQHTAEQAILLQANDRLRVSTYFDPRSSLYP